METEEEQTALTQREELAYRTSFNIIDVNNDGSLSKGELLKVWNVMGFNPTEEDVNKMMSDADMDADGKISFNEYLKIATQNRVFMRLNEEIESMKTAFRMFDKDFDGFITKAEFKAALQLNNDWITEKDIEDFFKDIDVDGDGKIEIDEFVKSEFCLPALD